MAKIVRLAERVSDTAASLTLLFIMGLSFVDVVGRNVFDRPIVGAVELTDYALVALTFLIYPVIAYREKHIVVDLFDRFIPRAMELFQRVLAAAIGAGIYGLLAYRFWVQGDRLVSYGEVTPQLNLPISPAYHFMAICSGLTAIAFLLTVFARTSEKTGDQEFAETI